MKLLFTPSARAQFLAALAYIRHENPPAAATFRDRAATALKRLEKFPESGRTLPEFPDLPFREVIVPPYRFFYRIKGKTVWIIACYHTARIPESPAQGESNS